MLRSVHAHLFQFLLFSFARFIISSVSILNLPILILPIFTVSQKPSKSYTNFILFFYSPRLDLSSLLLLSCNFRPRFPNYIYIYISINRSNHAVRRLRSFHHHHHQVRSQNIRWLEVQNSCSRFTRTRRATVTLSIWLNLIQFPRI